MRTQQKSILVLAIITVFMAAALFLPGLVSAGDLEPSAAPGPTMHTLDEIYNKLDQLVPGGETAPVEKTGQTDSYVTGDDGDLEKGVTWPNPRFTDNEDGTVTDNLTGLIWLKNANCGETTRTWASALEYCNNLANGSCGLTDGSVAGDWRLPNIKELQSLIDYGKYGPALSDNHPFENVQSTYYWSSTTDAGGTGYAWYVYMSLGSVYYNVKDLSSYVWPVRSDN